MIVIAEAVCTHHFRITHREGDIFRLSTHGFRTSAKHGTSYVCHPLVFNLVFLLVLDQKFGEAWTCGALRLTRQVSPSICGVHTQLPFVSAHYPTVLRKARVPLGAIPLIG
jgi:hypothetical protein